MKLEPAVKMWFNPLYLSTKAQYKCTLYSSKTANEHRANEKNILWDSVVLSSCSCGKKILHENVCQWWEQIRQILLSQSSQNKIKIMVFEYKIIQFKALQGSIKVVFSVKSLCVLTFMDILVKFCFKNDKISIVSHSASSDVSLWV